MFRAQQFDWVRHFRDNVTQSIVPTPPGLFFEANFRLSFQSLSFSYILIEWRTLICSTSLPLARTRWVRSTFLSRCTLSLQQWRWLTSATLIAFLSERMLGMQRIKHRATWSRSKYSNYNASSPPFPPFIENFVSTIEVSYQGFKKKQKYLIHKSSELQGVSQLGLILACFASCSTARLPFLLAAFSFSLNVELHRTWT